MSILGLPARCAVPVAVCKPKVVRKIITKIKVVKIPTPPPVTEIPVKPKQNDTWPAPWRGSDGDHDRPSRPSGGDSGDSGGDVGAPETDNTGTPEGGSTGT
ncbi:hypothetical protein EN814_33750, partial [Mesorhizobium sp. M2D.F.Ca.ET.171.01.1.1]|uniref:hypothetical protein n=1 Tax=Mesorhizobium sp. M2D.F.Ca.ET.171.01.1.1 TaxID=2563936 RepID=UPI001135A560